MLRLLLVLGAIFTLLTAWRFGLIVGLGFAAGTVIAYLSFRSLNKAVQSLASRIVDAKQPEHGFSLVHGFFLRYLLAGIVAYVIFTSSSRAFRGFLFGLCTPVAAMLVEAGFEAYAALRREMVVLNRKAGIVTYGATLVYRAFESPVWRARPSFAAGSRHSSPPRGDADLEQLCHGSSGCFCCCCLCSSRSGFAFPWIVQTLCNMAWSGSRASSATMGNEIIGNHYQPYHSYLVNSDFLS